MIVAGDGVRWLFHPVSGEKRGWFERWRESVRESLADSKTRGLSFEWAWRRAMFAYPPRQMELGPVVPSLEDDEPVLEFFRRACRDAYAGGASSLEDLPAALELLATDRPGLTEPRMRP